MAVKDPEGSSTRGGAQWAHTKHMNPLPRAIPSELSAPNSSLPGHIGAGGDRKRQ